MNVLAGSEDRSFDTAIDEALRPHELTRARSTVDGRNGYVARGEYFRILSGFLRSFPAPQLLVVFSSELDARPAEVLEEVFGFLGVREDYVPHNIDVRYRQAAIARRLPGLDLYAWQEWLSQARPARGLWHGLPNAARGRIDSAYQRASFLVEMWNAHRGDVEADMSSRTRALLCEHYRSDSLALAEALEVQVPWLDALAAR